MTALEPHRAITPSRGAEHARITGIGAYRPERVVTNDEVCEVLDSDDEWIQTRSGIRTRRFAGEGETLVSMATTADHGCAPCGFCITNSTTTRLAAR